MKKKALITGITGQDGSYLAEFLISKGYIVHGLRRRVSFNNLLNLNDLLLSNGRYHKNLYLHYGDITDSSNLYNLLKNIKPDEIYNLAAQSHVHLSYQIPEYTSEVNAIGTTKILNAVFNICPRSKFYQASTSELYGDSLKSKKLNENSNFYPCSPYSIAKEYSFNMVKNYRERGMYAVNGILFNHESPRRSSNFVTMKIIEAAIKIKKNMYDILYLGNLDAKRDWGYAKEYVEVMWKMLQINKPQDFVIATGKSTSVRSFVEIVFSKLGIDIIWKGKGINELGINKKTKKY